ncbi:MAG TPA: DUF3147 family protein [Chloroflexota bacterium]|nr:DUF3147 family protein [Chloroflexota bacterium]
MSGELVIRFFLGGLLVSVFAVLGDVVRPKSFAGVFGAAPSVALVTLALVFISHGGEYASVEARSMIAGAVGLAAYGLLVSRLLLRRRARTLQVASAALGLWAVVAFGLWAMLLR